MSYQAVVESDSDTEDDGRDVLRASAQSYGKVVSSSDSDDDDPQSSYNAVEDSSDRDSESDKESGAGLKELRESTQSTASPTDVRPYCLCPALFPSPFLVYIH